MEFYAISLNGEITEIQTFGDSPVDVPYEFQNRIFNSELKTGNICIKASNDLPNHSVKPGSNISLYAIFSDEEVKLAAFNNLAKDGKVLFPIKDNFGMLKDKYGIQWMFVNKN